MRTLFLTLGFVFMSSFAIAQNWSTYTPITRPPINNQGQQQFQQQFSQPQASYQRVSAIAKNGSRTELRLKIVDGRINSVEYYHTTLKCWCACVAVSQTNKFSLDDYEKVYDFKVQPQVGAPVYYF